MNEWVSEWGWMNNPKNLNRQSPINAQHKYWVCCAWGLRVEGVMRGDEGWIGVRRDIQYSFPLAAIITNLCLYLCFAHTCCESEWICVRIVIADYTEWGVLSRERERASVISCLYWHIDQCLVEKAHVQTLPLTTSNWRANECCMSSSSLKCSIASKDFPLALITDTFLLFLFSRSARTFAAAIRLILLLQSNAHGSNGHSIHLFIIIVRWKWTYAVVVTIIIIIIDSQNSQRAKYHFAISDRHSFRCSLVVGEIIQSVECVLGIWMACFDLATNRFHFSITLVWCKWCRVFL